MREADEPCTVLDWDSAFWRMRIAQSKVKTLDEETAERVLSWCSKKAINCLFFLAPSDDIETSKVAKAHGFDLIDCRLTFQRELDSAAESNAPKSMDKGLILPHKAQDIATLTEIARESHHDSRFYLDRRFPRVRCDDFYATWIRNSCEGAADHVLVAHSDRGPVGYITCHVPGEPRLGRIGLLAVNGANRRQGIGAALIDAAVNWFNETEVTELVVTTQGVNRPAQRLYEEKGFSLIESVTWFHKWFID